MELLQIRERSSQLTQITVWENGVRTRNGQRHFILHSAWIGSGLTPFPVKSILGIASRKNDRVWAEAKTTWTCNSNVPYVVIFCCLARGKDFTIRLVLLWSNRATRA